MRLRHSSAADVVDVQARALCAGCDETRRGVTSMREDDKVPAGVGAALLVVLGTGDKRLATRPVYAAAGYVEAPTSR